MHIIIVVKKEENNEIRNIYKQYIIYCIGSEYSDTKWIFGYRF